MTEDERQIAHFNTLTSDCRHRQKPQLQYEPGCWFIECAKKAECKCMIADGSNASPTPLLLRWTETH